MVEEVEILVCLLKNLHPIKLRQSWHFKVIHKFFIRTYQKAPIVQHYTYNTINTNNYIHISCTHINKGEHSKRSPMDSNKDDT